MGAAITGAIGTPFGFTYPGGVVGSIGGGVYGTIQGSVEQQEYTSIITEINEAVNEQNSEGVETLIYIGRNSGKDNINLKGD